MRTTITIDLPLLEKIRDIGRREHKTFKQVLHEVLTVGVNARNTRDAAPSPFRQWHAKDMGALINYADKEALYRALDQRP